MEMSAHYSSFVAISDSCTEGVPDPATATGGALSCAEPQ